MEYYPCPVQAGALVLAIFACTMVLMLVAFSMALLVSNSERWHKWALTGVYWCLGIMVGVVVLALLGMMVMAVGRLVAVLHIGGGW